VRLTHLLPQFHLYATIGLIYDAKLKAVLLVELTCPFNSHVDLSAAREHKQRKSEYLQIVAKLDHLVFMSQYHTTEIGCLGHNLKETIYQ